MFVCDVYSQTELLEEKAAKLATQSTTTTQDVEAQTVDVFVSSFDMESLLKSPLNQPDRSLTTPLVLKTSVAVEPPRPVSNLTDASVEISAETYDSDSECEETSYASPTLDADESASVTEAVPFERQQSAPTINIMAPSDSMSTRESSEEHSSSAERGLLRLTEEIDRMLAQTSTKHIGRRSEDAALEAIVAQMEADFEALKEELNEGKHEKVEQPRLTHLQRAMKQFALREKHLQQEYETALKRERVKIDELKTENEQLKQKIAQCEGLVPSQHSTLSKDKSFHTANEAPAPTFSGNF